MLSLIAVHKSEKLAARAQPGAAARQSKSAGKPYSRTDLSWRASIEPKLLECSQDLTATDLAYSETQEHMIRFPLVQEAQVQKLLDEAAKLHADMKAAEARSRVRFSDWCMHTI